MKDGCSSDLGAIVVGDTAVHGEDFPILRGLQEPIVPENTASFVPPSSISHMPTYPCPSLTPTQRMAPVYPALQLFYLLPGSQEGSPPALAPVYSSLPHGQPLFVPALTCGAAQRTHLDTTELSQKNLSEGKIEKEDSCLGSQGRSEKFRGQFFRPWENACSDLGGGLSINCFSQGCRGRQMCRRYDEGHGH